MTIYKHYSGCKTDRIDWCPTKKFYFKCIMVLTIRVEWMKHKQVFDLCTNKTFINFFSRSFLLTAKWLRYSPNDNYMYCFEKYFLFLLNECMIILYKVQNYMFVWSISASGYAKFPLIRKDCHHDHVIFTKALQFPWKTDNFKGIVEVS